MKHKLELCSTDVEHKRTHFLAHDMNMKYTTGRTKDDVTRTKEKCRK